MKKGFTLMETLMVIAIAGIAVTIVTLSLSKINSSKALDTDVSLVVSVLNEARSMTLSSVDALQYGVNLQDSQVVLFSGSSYSTSSPSNVFTTLNSLVGIRNISLSGGGTSVVFQRLTGETSQSGTLEVYLRSATTSYKTVTINSTGVIED